MKIANKLAAGALVAGAMLTAGAGTASAQTLGWNSNLTGVCANAGCTVVNFTQYLLGLKPTDNDNAPVPGALFPIGNPGYIELLTIHSLSASPYQFTGGAILGGSTGWSVNVTGGGNNLLVSQDSITPWDGAPVTVQATLSGSAIGRSFASTGTAHLDQDGHFFTAAGVLDDDNGTYENGVFENANLTVTPEPGSMALLATGVLGLVGVVRRRRRSA